MKVLITSALTFLAIHSNMAQSLTQNIQQLLIEDWQRAKAYTQEYIEAMPKEKFDFKPTEDNRTFAEQFLHLAQGNVNLTGNGTSANRIWADINLEKTDSLKTKEMVMKHTMDSYNYVIASIEEMDVDSFSEIVERGPFKVTKLGWINKGFEHQTHHRGQTAIYLRLSGIVPPAAKLF